MPEVIPFYKTVRKKYRLFSQFVLGFRHFAEGRDGLKPVQRRALWTMREIGAVDTPHMAKTAEVAGKTMGLYHPHEDSSISKALANMSQADMASPLVMGVGNWGSHDEEPAAPRYTSCYLSPYAMTMFDPDELSCVPMDPSFNGKSKEPRFLPAQLPHLLIGGCDSLAPGYKGNIPPCKPEWVAECVYNVIHNKPIKLPDALNYRWGGKLCSFEKSWLHSGNGTASFVPSMSIESSHRSVILKSLAPKLSINSVEANIENDPAFAGIAEESAEPGQIIRVVIRSKRGHDLTEFARRIRKACTTRDHYFFLQIRQRTGDDGDVEYDPIIQGPKQFLSEWVEWRSTIVAGAAKHRADNLRAEIVRINLLLKVIDKRRELLKILDQSKTRDDIRKRTMVLLSCSVEQANEVMSIPWPRLARLESAVLIEKREQHRKSAKENDAIVSNPMSRLETDVSAAVAAIAKSATEAAVMLDSESRKARRR